MPTARQLTLLLALAIFACGSPTDEGPTDPLVPEPLEIDESELVAPELVIEPALMRVATYDGSGEMVHPDALVFPHQWQGRRFWFAATPYPLGNAGFENPSAFAGDSALDWREIPGADNPIARPVMGAYLSDPDLTYDPARDRIRLYYRQTTDDTDQIYLRTSQTGSDWSVPQLVLQDTKFALISPAVVRETDGSWRLWSVNASAGGCRTPAAAMGLTQRRSRDGVHWNAAENVSLKISGYVPWHWDVQYIRARQEYWALIAAYPERTDCSCTSIFFARSADGTTWTTSPAALLQPGSFEPLRDMVYRSTFRYYPSDDAVRVWFSGARYEAPKFHFSLATARYPMSEFMRRVSGPAASHSVSALREPREGLLEKAREDFIHAFP